MNFILKTLWADTLNHNEQHRGHIKIRQEPLSIDTFVIAVGFEKLSVDHTIH